MTRLWKVFATLAVLGAATALSACGSNASGSSTSGKLALVAYSTPKEAYAALIPAFQKTPAGKGTSFTQSFGPSGDQTRAVIAGLPADVVELSLQPDVDKLVKAGKVASSWNADKWHGFVTDSVVAFVVRKGNPKNIRSWADLVKPGVQVI